MSGPREWAPLQLHRTFTTGSVADRVTCLTWSPTDSSVLAAAGRNGTVRIWTVHKQQQPNHYEPVTLAGHKRAVVGVYFSSVS